MLAHLDQVLVETPPRLSVGAFIPGDRRHRAAFRVLTRVFLSKHSLLSRITSCESTSLETRKEEDDVTPNKHTDRNLARTRGRVAT